MHEFLKFRVRIFSFVLISCTNSYVNSYVNFVHEFRNFWQNFEKISTNSREFVKIMLQMGCTVLSIDQIGKTDVKNPSLIS